MLLVEWQKLAWLVENAWKGELDDDRAAAYFAFLEPYPVLEVEAALHQLAHTGKPFMPTAPEIIAAIREARGAFAPAFQEALGMVFTVTDGHPESTWDRRVEDLHPAVRAFALTEGVARLRRMPFGDPEFGELRRRELEGRYQDLVDRAEAHENARTALERVQRRSLAGGPRGLGRALEHLQPGGGRDDG